MGVLSFLLFYFCTYLHTTDFKYSHTPSPPQLFLFPFLPLLHPHMLTMINITAIVFLVQQLTQPDLEQYDGTPNEIEADIAWKTVAYMESLVRKASKDIPEAHTLTGPDLPTSQAHHDPDQTDMDYEEGLPDNVGSTDIVSYAKRVAIVEDYDKI
jgi:hypothetical protein